MFLLRIPSSKARKVVRQSWLRQLRNVRANLNIGDNTRICRRHFADECFDSSGTLRPDSVPTIFPSKPVKEMPKRRTLMRNVPEGLPKRSKQQESDDDATTGAEFMDTEILEDPVASPEPVTSTVSTQTDPPAWCSAGAYCGCYCHACGTRDVACGAALPDVNVMDLRHNDHRTRFLTGFFNFATFLLMLKTLVRHGTDRFGNNILNYWGGASLQEKKYHAGKGKPGPKKTLDMATEFLITMIWYRLGLVEEHLSLIFKVSIPTISRTLITWTQFIYEHSVGLVYMPSKEEVLMNMPLHFINHSNTYRVDDCTEFFLEKPSGLEAQCVTWSEYKHHNTIKCLIGVTPDGQVTYISAGWGGRASDRHIEDKENALAQIPEGMALMADKGFEIQDLVPHGVDVILPPKVSSKSQMSDFEFFATVDVAEPRIVVEMKMEQAKNFRILQTTFPISRICTAEQIIYNCFAFTNLLPPLFTPACGPDQTCPLPIYSKNYKQ